jgi:hypothetical protein
MGSLLFEQCVMWSSIDMLLYLPGQEEAGYG